MLDDVLQMQSLTDQERLLFQSEMNARRKDPTTGVLLCLFTGGLGGHHFYLGRMGLGIAYLLFCWTFIPALVAVVELFLMSGRVRAYNAEVAAEIGTKLRALRPGAEGPPPALPAAQPKGGALKTAALGAVGGAVAGAAVANALETDGAEALDVAGEGADATSTIASLLE